MSYQIDRIDTRILDALQRDGRLTNNELAEQIDLSASQCSRRRAKLEESGLISGYHAKVDRQSANMGLVSMVLVNLAAHSESNAKNFKDLVNSLPNVQEAHALTGEMDYQLKVITRDLDSLSVLINKKLLPHESVQQVKTAVVLETLKETNNVPVTESEQ